MEKEYVVEIKGLRKQYGDLVAINRLDLSIRQGQVFGLLGPNGSGKTTLIECLLACIHYTEGQIKLFGKKMQSEEKAIKKEIGIITQDVAVFEELTVYENIRYFCGLYIKSNKTLKRYVEEAIEFVELGSFRKFYPKQLSGGLLRRLHIACGIAHKPKLIILDEPTVAVDPQSRNKILEGIVALKEQGATIIYTSHYMEEVEQICDELAIIDHGRIIAKGTTQSLKERFASTYQEPTLNDVFLAITGKALRD